MPVMIPDLQASLVCDDVRQENNGKFILIGIFDIFHPPALPFACPRLCVVNRWCGGEGTFRARTRILAPDEATPVIETQPIEVRLSYPEASATNIEIFMTVVFRQAGTHWVEVLLDDELKIRYPLRVLPHATGEAHPGRVPPA